jgi:hypothetical protein
VRILKGAIGLAIAVTVVTVAVSAGGRGDNGSPSDGASGAVEVPGSVAPGYPGSGSSGSSGGEPIAGGGPATNEPCGEHVDGTGPDGVVSYTPCPGDEPITDPGPQLVEPRPGMADVRARPFDTATVGDDGVTVRIDFVSGVEPCYVLDHIDVRYGPDAVTITLFEGHDPEAGDVACIEIGVFKRVIVTLDEPLGDREIVDGGAA